MPSRKQHGAGERFEYDLLSRALRAKRPGGRRLFDERLLAEPQCVNVRRAGITEPFDVFANVILLAPRAAFQAAHAATPAALDHDAGWAAGATRSADHAGLAFGILGDGDARRARQGPGVPGARAPRSGRARAATGVPVAVNLPASRDHRFRQ